MAKWTFRERLSQMIMVVVLIAVIFGIYTIFGGETILGNILTFLAGLLIFGIVLS